MAGYSVSNQHGAAVSRGHNIRDERFIKNQDHIERGGVFEVWKDETLRHAYDRIFGYAKKEYNKNKRKDRKIKDYLDKIKKDTKKHPVYEVIMTIGNSNNQVDPEVGKEILKEFVDNWSTRNPNFEMIGAYYHADERDPDTGRRGTPHVHIDYIPVARNLDYGMSTQNSLSKALEQQGFVTNGMKNTAIIQWQKSEREVFKEICIKHGVIMLEEKRDEKHHLDTETFKAKKKLETLNKQVEEKTKEYNELKVKTLSPQELMNIKETRSGQMITLLTEDYLSVKAMAFDKNNIEQQLKEVSNERDDLAFELEKTKLELQKTQVAIKDFNRYKSVIKEKDPYLDKRAEEISKENLRTLNRKNDNRNNDDIVR